MTNYQLLPFALLLVAAAAALFLIAGSLSNIAEELRSGRLQGPPGPQGIQGPPGEARPVEHPVLATSGARKDLSEILHRTAEGWVHHGWAETGSPAYQQAWKTRGLAVRRHGEEIDFGNQDA